MKKWFPFLLLGYVDIGTGQVITSSLAPILAAASSILVGIFGFLLLRVKQITAFIHRKFRPGDKRHPELVSGSKDSQKDAELNSA